VPSSAPFWGDLAAEFSAAPTACGDRDVIIDVTFPAGPPWDGHSSMPLACGEGQDFPAGDDPAAEKAALEASYCDS
jgi:hypothetical protein